MSLGLWDGPSMFVSKDKNESWWVESKSQELLHNSLEDYLRMKVSAFMIIANVMFKLLKKYSPEDSKQKRERLNSEAKLRAESTF